MSTSEYKNGGLETRQNVDAVAGSDPNGIRPSKPRAEPITTHGHKPGVIASEADSAPEFHAQTLPAGSSPADRTFNPSPADEAPLAETNPSASSTLPGSTSADVHTGYGHPGSGQTSNELRGDGRKQRSGLEGAGARVDEKLDSLDPRQRALRRDDAQLGEGESRAGTRGSAGGPLAEERLPETAATVAMENSGPSRDSRVR
ncbi:uncharacterized protein PV09_04021 [Verruconis gallopava]|uniref:Uncharacterized protein n=1 Tax=Verruconis gallopava TaxID=253628 RepID=A0A0D2B0D5_9PEZI|nr:uncharacterized protein PV09_04021 [Verruconis gallopava]KIW04839.1 hypothetical protein PV09_04021 [Verruconis gallopava]